MGENFLQENHLQKKSMNLFLRKEQKGKMLYWACSISRLFQYACLVQYEHVVLNAVERRFEPRSRLKTSPSWIVYTPCKPVSTFRYK